jgi:hypothetical protein
VLQIIGGLSGIAFIGWALATQVSEISSASIGLGEILIDVIGVVAGVTLWRGTSFGRRASMAIQFIQLPKIVSPAIVFMFSFGFDLWVHASPPLLGIQFAILGSNQVFLNVQNVPLDFGISITAIVALVILKKYKPAVRIPLAPLPPPPPFEWPVCDEGAANESGVKDSKNGLTSKDSE